MLTAIEPSQKGIETRAFLPDQAEEAEAWIEENNGQRNLYFSVAEVIEPENKKASIENVAAVHWLHVDIDAGPGDLLAELDRIKRLVTTELPTGAVEPTVVIYSGGGYQAFWKLDEPIQVRGNADVAAEVARYNKQLELLFGGDSCHNVDRIMRLPGTMNIPNQRKVAKGRVPVQADVLEFRETSYPVASFNQAADVGRTGDADDIQISGNVQRLVSIDDLDEWNVTDRTKVICVQGNDPDDPDRHPSRSEWLFDCVCNLVRCDVPDEVIYSVLTDEGFKISESVLEASNPDRYAKKQIKSAKEVAVSEWLHRLNSKYAVIGNLGGRCLVVEEVYDEAMSRHRLVKQSFTDFQNRYRNQFEVIEVGDKPKRVPVGKWWLDHPQRRQYDRLVFQPGRDPEGAYNLWRGFGCNALPGSAHESFLKHLHETVCQGVDHHYQYLVGWLARAVQHPDQPGHTAIVMRGRQGTGKSFFAKHFGRLFGRHFLHVSNASHLVGNFNGHLRDAIVVFGDEAFYAGDKRHESVLKTLITEESLVIETKGVDAEASPNYCHLILASNSNWVVPVGAGDRRYFVIDVSEKYARDVKHFGGIARDLEGGGYENLLHYLMHYDLSEFNVQAIPATDAKADHLREGEEREDPWGHLVGEIAETGEIPWPTKASTSTGEIVFNGNWTLRYLREAYPTLKRGTLTAGIVGNNLKKFGFEGGRKVNPGNITCMAFPSLADLRAAVARYRGEPQDWAQEITEYNRTIEWQSGDVSNRVPPPETSF